MGTIEVADASLRRTTGDFGSPQTDVVSDYFPQP
jgi:hypothetical protein